MIRLRLLLAIGLLATTARSESIDLAGRWKLHLDSKPGLLVPAGEVLPSPAELAFDDSIDLPGTTDLARKGPRVTAPVPHEYHLNREFNFIGPASYARRITIPADWRDREVELFLERVMWQSRVWIDGREAGEPRDSLSTPHVHRLGRLAPGEHEIVIRVDNRMIHPIGDKGHGYGAQTQSLWNGIVGKMELRPVPVRSIDLVRVFPSLDGNVKVEVTGDFGPGATLTAGMAGDARAFSKVPVEGNTATLGGKAVDEPTLWSESSPVTYQMHVTLADASGKMLDTRTTTFGFREIRREGNQLLVNGSPVFLRGNLECAVFPKLGHPPVDVESWRRIWSVYKEHNLNHARFHSWCPPEAAFTAADESGIHLQVETPIWIDHWMTKPNPRPEMDTAGHPQGLGRNDRDIDAFTTAELRRILDSYGNHPSFTFFCLGNELGTSNFEVTGRWIAEAKQYDTRRLYAASTARTITPSCDFNATHNIPGIGWCRQHVEFGTDWDYESKYGAAPVPILAHEIGQWPVYVDWAAELPKYTGPLKPYRLEAMAADARTNGLYDRAADLRAASGAGNRILYRYEIESFLRTPSCRGFQLLNMQDFSGQGEALVGWLDSFYESKGTTDPVDFRRYCAPTVPMLRLPSFVFRSSEKPVIKALVRHMGEDDLTNTDLSWKLVTAGGTKIDSGTLARTDIRANEVTRLGEFVPDLSSVLVPTHATLTLDVGGFSNSYDIWIYPDEIDPAVPADVVFASEWSDSAKAALEQGGTVVLSAHFLGGAKTAKLAAWFPLYWSVPFFPGQNIETIGLLVDSDHPALAGFPTPPHADWNWFRLAKGAHGFDLTGITPADYRGIAEPVSDFHHNRRLASIFEGRVGNGKLLVCGYDILDPETPEAAALRRSLLDYAASEEFAPAHDFDPATLDGLFSVPELNLPKLPERFDKADLYVNAAAKVPVEGRNMDWAKGLDHILRQADGVDYTVVGDGDWRDAKGSAWHGRKLTVTITPRAGVAGKLSVRFDDWNRNGRTGVVTFEGKSRELGAHTEGEWLEFPVIREDTNDSRLILTAEVRTGPNLMITDIAFVPED
ncbi:MAG: glycoside hydrolase family 2 [Akkermansiaceae bacterium]|nr:glycoside hydrolase family 2 [Akkermansiaceae bacterium]